MNQQKREREKIAKAIEILVKTEFEHRVKQSLPYATVIWPKHRRKDGGCDLPCAEEKEVDSNG